MLETRRFLYIHIPKTGGTSVTSFLKKVIPNENISWHKCEDEGCHPSNPIHYYATHEKYWRYLVWMHRDSNPLTAGRDRGRDIIATIRNPFGWYLSNYLMLDRLDNPTKSKPKSFKHYVMEESIEHDKASAAQYGQEGWSMGHWTSKLDKPGYYTNELARYTFDTDPATLGLTAGNCPHFFKEHCAVQFWFKLEALGASDGFAGYINYLHPNLLGPMNEEDFPRKNIASNKNKSTIEYYDNEMIDTLLKREEFVFKTFSYGVPS